MSTKIQTPKQFQPITITQIARVSAHGSGLYIRIPREITDSLNIEKGDRLFILMLGLRKGD